METVQHAGSGSNFPTCATIVITIIAGSTAFPSTTIVKILMNGKNGVHRVLSLNSRMAKNVRK
jgi:hypothetical protein